MGDAISHAVLPGLALAFIVSQNRASWTMFLGAALAGVVTALFTQWIAKFGKVDRGAAMGIVFTTLFAIGLILIKQSADHVDLDASCVLYGAIEYTSLDQVTLWENEEAALILPRAALVTGGALVFNLLIIGLFYKEFKMASFDPALAKTLGFRPQLMHYLLMTMVAVTTVASFEAVGSIIVIAMLIVPPATAFLLTRNLPLLMGLSLIFAAASAVLGHLGAKSITFFGLPETSSSGMMATVAGLLFLPVWFFGPHGLLRAAPEIKVEPDEGSEC